MSAGVVFQQMVIICLLMLTGYVLYKKKIVGDVVSPGISAIVIHVCSPAMLIHSCLDRDPAITNVKVLLSLAGGAIIYAVLLISSIVI
ncbi:MAG: AEC family transporter, partial [Clostridiales bacterium]|nr:AEC family transporter [Candidatus Blautia equi]